MHLLGNNLILHIIETTVDENSPSASSERQTADYIEFVLHSGTPPHLERARITEKKEHFDRATVASDCSMEQLENAFSIVVL